MLPDYLRSTHRLVAASFPNGVDADAYVPLLKLLAEHMSQRNLADVIAAYTGRDVGIVHNDVLGAIDAAVPEQELRRVKALLDANGFERWKSE